jgi:hypothetical protein
MVREEAPSNVRSFRILENWHPRVLNERNIRRKMRAVIKSLDLKNPYRTLEVRSPKENAKIQRKYIRSRKRAPYIWHTDISKKNRRTRNTFVLMWSNKLPTEYRVIRSKKKLEAKAGDIVLLNNAYIEHKARKGSPRGRWFARQFWGLRK